MIVHGWRMRRCGAEPCVVYGENGLRSSLATQGRTVIAAAKGLLRNSGQRVVQSRAKIVPSSG